MAANATARVWIQWSVVLLVVVAGSMLSSRLWRGERAVAGSGGAIVYDAAMTIGEFGQQNGLPDPMLKEVFQLRSRSDLTRRLGDCGLSRDQVIQAVGKGSALLDEHGSKNWRKIRIKFIAWAVFLAVVFSVLRRGALRERKRRVVYAIGVLLFGVILGADPAPMGTVKDAVALYGANRVVFPPRMIALAVFLLMVVIANKSICAWGCQAGALQDLGFRINRDGKGKAILRQYRIPFVVSNSIRAASFLIFVAVAFTWALDLIDPIDPFKVFHPQKLGIIGAAFVGALLLASLFVYRPWCHLLCPFGLLGWLAERKSLFRIRVDYSKCIACEACTKACPSPVMEAILKRDKTIPDCFSCGSCIEVCPVDAIRFSIGRRELPPEGKFTGEPPSSPSAGRQEEPCNHGKTAVPAVPH